ncbi:Zeta-sarcoglycan [Acipenser ruthenus]|uniref:Zeta-sarcoglycan n=1 Tax=Acipenser ruthenus TaxID=7906 RepID=A0A444UEL8_ACIRT|nr:Zeta-sarcoglycan [Acipenser ruthenus]
MAQEQYILATQPNNLQRPGGAPIYPVGIYGWRKRCLYFFVLLLLVIMIVNLALTIWILKVMNFTVDGMGNLRVNKQGVRLEGISEFLLPLYVKEIQSRKDSPLILQSDRNVTVNARNDLGQLTGQLTVGSQTVEAQCQRFEVLSSDSGKVLFSADKDEISIGAGKLRVTGHIILHYIKKVFKSSNDGTYNSSKDVAYISVQNVDCSNVQKMERTTVQKMETLESPTRTLTMEAPKGVEISADAGDFKATCRKELQLESTEGQIFLNANTIRLGNLPHGTFAASSPGSTGPKQIVYELCVCPNGKLYLSPAGTSSTCQSTSNVCLWS